MHRIRRLIAPVCEPCANEANVLAQDVELVGIGERHLEPVDGFLDRVEFLDQRFTLRGRDLAKRAAFDSDQRAIPAVDA